MILRGSDHKRTKMRYTIMTRLASQHHCQKAWEWKGMRMDPETPLLGYPNRVSGTRCKCLLVENKAPSMSSWEMLCSFYSSLRQFSSPPIHFSFPVLKVCHLLMRFLDHLLNVYTYTHSHVCMCVHSCWAELNGCSNKHLQWWCFGTHSPSVPTFPTMLPAQGHWRVERNHWDPLEKSQRVF